MCLSLACLSATWPHLGQLIPGSYPPTLRVTQTLPFSLQAEPYSMFPSPRFFSSYAGRTSPLTGSSKSRQTPSLETLALLTPPGCGVEAGPTEEPPSTTSPAGRVAGVPPPPLPKAARRRPAASLEPRSQLPPQRLPRIQEQEQLRRRQQQRPAGARKGRLSPME